MPEPMPQQRIVISGGSGLIGQALIESLQADGVTVTQLVRRPAHTPDEVQWLEDDNPLDPAVIEGATAVINLNGASIGKFPWTRRYRQTLRSSRIKPTRVLASAIKQVTGPKPALLNASAVGFYGDRPGEHLNEHSTAGDTFLAQLCQDWEQEALACADETRVVLLRTSPIIHRDGVLKPMMLLTRLGLSGPLGDGEQNWPWISLQDEVRAIRHLIVNQISGPVNLSGPNPATANDVGRALAESLRRPYLLPVPEWALRLGLSKDAADSLLLNDATVHPEVLLANGFEFRHTTVEQAVRAGV